MKYRKETINKIKETYPLREDLIEKAEQGSDSLRLILDELANEIFTARDIVSAFESSRNEALRNLYDRARAAMQKEEAYNMVMEDMYNSFNPENVSEEIIPTDNE